MTPHERFWSKVDKTGSCWVWTGSVDRDGYGRLGDRRLAHRVAYELAGGSATGGLGLDHLCHEWPCRGGSSCPHRRCVNPRHLRPSTHAENMHRAAYVQRPYCGNGHPRTDENVRHYVSREGWVRQLCRPCDVERQRAYQARLRQAA